MDIALFNKIRSYNYSFDEERLFSVLSFVRDRYEETEGSIDYPFAVLEILLPLKPDEESIFAVLLYDLYSRNLIEERSIRELFGNSVAMMLLNLKKLGNLKYAENDKHSQLDVLRKMFLVMARDLRVILIWLSLRICKMEALEYSSDSHYNYKIAKETMDVYVPIAARLGVYRMKITLEDMSFKHLKPNEYEIVLQQLDHLDGTTKDMIDGIVSSLQNFFFSRHLILEVSGRLKSIYSIYRKLQSKHLSSVNDLTDLIAVRVVVPAAEGEDVTDKLYLILGLIHSEWKSVSRKFKDYISVPKVNGYKSLHTVVLGLVDEDPSRPVEIQIRDTEMHRNAEYGIASHWIYKSGGKSVDKDIQEQVAWLKGLEKIHENMESEMEMVKEVEVNVFKDRIFVLTPKGEVRDLPFGSVPIDFAYSIHTDIGNRCVTARVNGVQVPLYQPLHNGDVVEIVTDRKSTPKIEWLSMVKTKFAKRKIKAWFTKKIVD